MDSGERLLNICESSELKGQRASATTRTCHGWTHCTARGGVIHEGRLHRGVMWPNVDKSGHSGGGVSDCKRWQRVAVYGT